MNPMIEEKRGRRESKNFPRSAQRKERKEKTHEPLASNVCFCPMSSGGIE